MPTPAAKRNRPRASSSRTPATEAPEASRALAKGLRLLEVLSAARAPTSLARLAAAIELGKASTLRLLQTLVQSGYVAQNSRGEYHLQGNWRIPAIDEWWLHLLHAALPHITRLNDETAETVSLAVLRDDHIRVLETLESPQQVRMSNWRNRILPPYASSLAKAIAAFQTSETLESLINVYGVYRTTEKTITDRHAIRSEMERVRAFGYAREFEETVVGGCCFAAPIREQQSLVRAAVSISLPTVRLTAALEKRISGLVLACASDIADSLVHH